MGMFDDFFSSSKGPGSIAMLLALFVLASFCGLGFLVFDGRFNGDNATKLMQTLGSQQDQITHLEDMVAELEDTAVQSKEYAKLQHEVSSLRRMISNKQEIVRGLEGEVAGAREALSRTQQEWEGYKNDYRAAERAKAVGMKIAELVTLDGKVFKNVTVRKLDNLSMRIMHDSGSTSIAWDQLPLDLQDRFQFDAKQAEEAAKIAAARKAAWDQQVQSGSASIKINQLKNSILMLNHEIDKQQRAIKDNHGLIASNTASVANYRRLAAEARSRHALATAAGRRSSHLATATRMENSATNKERTNAQIAQNNREAEEKIREYEQKIRDVEREIEELKASSNTN